MQGRIVESIVLQDSSIVRFDRWESASVGRDRRARIRAEYVEGYVDGAFRRYGLAEILELELGVDDSTRTVTIVSIGAIVVIVGILGTLFLYTFTIGWH